MAGGFRITESGDVRIAENSDARVTENFFDGAVSLVSEATITPLANASVQASADLASDGSVMLVGVATAFGRSDLSAASNLAGLAEVKLLVFTSIAASGTATATAQRTRPASFAAQSDGSVAFDGVRIRYAAFDEQASGSIASAANRIRNADFRSYVEDGVRITESGDVRVTEDGIDRLAVNIPYNSGLGLILARSQLIPFSSDLSVKYLGDWKSAEVYVNVNENWLEPEKAYMKISGDWKRIA
jgi:hypothetical protein